MFLLFLLNKRYILEKNRYVSVEMSYFAKN